MDYRQTVATMKKVNLRTKRLLDQSNPKKLSREELLSLEYQRGEEVIDSVTGERGRIDAGTTTYITRVRGT